MADVDALTEQLVASGRWSDERAKQLADDLLACGPVTPVA
jgi:polyhydroxyalkanoate synthesis regulator phasin